MPLSHAVKVDTALIVLQALEMEHRDLHLSNILVKPTSQDSFLFRVNGRDISIPSHGIKATIVDYTLSRMKQGNQPTVHCTLSTSQCYWLCNWTRGSVCVSIHLTLSSMVSDDCVLFNDLDQLPWLFEGEGDIQFKVYRNMRMATEYVINGECTISAGWLPRELKMTVFRFQGL